MLRRRLLLWYRRHGRKLPWREVSDPYLVWVSEVMLQQTQVSIAIPFYQRFIGRFPTIMKLADAREPEVLALWSGLGYYSRARRLLEAARIVARDHQARVPDDPMIFGRLPGVGRYTTGAVLSIAYGRPLPVVDGNVARVLSRLFAMPSTMRDPTGARELWRTATELVPMHGAGHWNQALMELGALVCTPRAPRCNSCPVRSECVAFSTHRVNEFPPVPARRRASRVRQAVVLVERDGALLMRPREGRLLAGLWEPPGIEIDGGAELVRDAKAGATPRSVSRRLAAELEKLGIIARIERTGASIRHTITFRRIDVELWRGTIEKRPITGRALNGDPTPRAKRRAHGSSAGRRASTPRLRYVDPLAPRVAITGLARKIGRLLARSSGR